ncbi:hypothetical protein A1O7_05444 [Cladophialophora yegresii CBS 114405]|uniref:Zn(2)-C6 fungal-type domain-containing protein n=1 Tax=Cladophialophora yegresii CBS 114405 TaxID=1182544 RepID=W9W0J4_9EURO|nr:uncharacterized protein A1O7_05444 [Cladophialophora yegresii CBS 114405]EXJ58021.1 hypothetical protein A1O7_05444 [Cladophialophora yegresii CBS 114405]
MSSSSTPVHSSNQPSQHSATATQDLPCFDCRRRKVKCSKTEPCANCQRFGVECIYEDTGRLVHRRTPTSNDPLARRIAELEELVRNLSRRPQQGNPMEIMTENIAQKFGSQASPVGNPEGRLVFDKDRSRYLHKGFWAAMYDEVRDLKFTLQEEPKTHGDTFLFPYVREETSRPALVDLSTRESDFLVQTFVEKVDPFVKILHKPTLHLELNHFRRGILANPTEFQVRLFAVYALGLLPLCSTMVEYRFHESKKGLLSRYRSHVEQGLSQLNLTTTQSLSTLQTFLLYITFLFWTGEMLHVSTLLAVALSMARRMGLNRDGAHFHLNPWEIELRRRLWHHLVLLDAWCVENHGLQPLLQPGGDSDTSLPLNENDSAWDTSEFSSYQPQPRNNFTDATISLMHYEFGSLTKFILEHPYTPATTTRSYLAVHNEVLRQAHHRMDILYMRNLDTETNILHRLAKDLFDHSFRRLRLMQLQPLVNAKAGTIAGPADPARPGLEAKMYQLAVEYCKATQTLIDFYTPYSLDWAIIRAFSWHSVATMLSMVLRHEALSSSLEARAARHRIELLFQNRPSIDYLAGNDNLWEPLRMLRAELAVRQALPVRDSRVGMPPAGNEARQGQGQTPAHAHAHAHTGGAQGPFEISTEGADDLVSMTSTTIDPALFSLATGYDGGVVGSEQWCDFEAYM